MRRPNTLIVLVAGIVAGAAASYWYAHRPETVATPASAEQSQPAKAERTILYYRNPMGLPDTSPVPKKDTMGMDYIPVYADEQDDPNTVKVSLDKIQRSGVRTEKVEALPISRTVRGIGTVQHDKSLLSVVTVRSDGYIEKLFVNKTGQHVDKGEPLFRFYSSQIQLAQADLLVAHAGARQLVQSRGGEEPGGRHAEIAQSRRARQPHRGGAADHDQPANHRLGFARDRRHRREESDPGPACRAGDELFRIADHSSVWVVAEVAEADIGEIKLGMPATVTLRAFPGTPQEGVVAFIYPEMMNPETRTITVRIELPNPDGKMKPGMYADVVFHAGEGEAGNGRSGQRHHRQRRAPSRA